MKLAAKFYGPYQVLERIGEVAHQLELPTSSRLHQIFHLSLLKQQVSSRTTTSTAIPEYASEHQALQAALDFHGNATTGKFSYTSKDLVLHTQLGKIYLFCMNDSQNLSLGMRTLLTGKGCYANRRLRHYEVQIAYYLSSRGNQKEV
jgi:hypothetical protein